MQEEDVTGNGVKINRRATVDNQDLLNYLA